MITPGKACVNHAKGKPSYIALESDVDVFSNATGVSVTDENGDPWSASPIYRHNPKILLIRLKGKRGTTVKDDSVSDSGQLTVTVTSPAATVQVPVDYVDDPNP